MAGQLTWRSDRRRRPQALSVLRAFCDRAFHFTHCPRRVATADLARIHTIHQLGPTLATAVALTKTSAYRSMPRRINRIYAPFAVGGSHTRRVARNSFQMPSSSSYEVLQVWSKVGPWS